MLTALVGSPSPVLIALSVLAASVLWLISRTRWEPAVPVRLRRRRRWGAIATSAGRLYREQPRLFLGIGLLFVPIGVLITFVHYLIFRVGGLAPLVNSVGASNALVATLAIILGGLFTVAGLAIVQSVTAIAIVELDDERSVTALAAYKLALGRLRPLFGAIVLAAVILAILEPTAVARREQKHRADKRAEQQGDARDEERERAGAPRSTS